MFDNLDLNQLINSKEFKRMFKGIYDEMIKNLPKHMQGLSPEDFKREFLKYSGKIGFKDPIIYGFKINMGPEGKPVIDSFGNVKKEPYSGKPEVKKTREPLIEVYEEGEQIIVIAEMPGIIKEDIELKATNRSLTISTKQGVAGRNYFKEITLPANVNSDVAKARLTNGILEIKLKKLDEKETDIKVD
ncbi:MAG: Hsp20/alpha crystallin family protein [Candidatus Lokiarchaeota archaeon]|nr:Hsp20/alpha crystallin family protein [Candidatus Lokiarchaeota archaeon]